MATTLTTADLLILTVEECSEVQQAVTKIQRFGYDIDHGIGYGNNRDVLAKEAGELFAVIAALDLPREIFWEAFRNKLPRAEDAKAKYGIS